MTLSTRAEQAKPDEARGLLEELARRLWGWNECPGGVNPKTLELGPILVVDDFTREGTFWQIQPLGLAVRARLKEQDNA